MNDQSIGVVAAVLLVRMMESQVVAIARLPAQDDLPVVTVEEDAVAAADVARIGADRIERRRQSANVRAVADQNVALMLVVAASARIAAAVGIRRQAVGSQHLRVALPQRFRRQDVEIGVKVVRLRNGMGVKGQTLGPGQISLRISAQPPAKSSRRTFLIVRFFDKLLHNNNNIRTSYNQK